MNSPRRAICMVRRFRFRRSVAQLVEHRSPKPGVGVRSLHPCHGGAEFCTETSTGYESDTSAISNDDDVENDNGDSPFKFLQEVRTETNKVTWPSRRETMITTAMVFVMVAVSSVFFLVADQIIRMVVTFVLGIGG